MIAICVGVGEVLEVEIAQRKYQCSHMLNSQSQ